MPRARMVLALLVLTAVVAAQAGCAAEESAGGARAAAVRFRVLVFAKTTGYRHRSIPVAEATIRGLGREHRFAVDQTEDERRFTQRNLARYAALVFLSSTGEPLAPGAHRRALRHYIRHRGGFLGIHAASDSLYDWPWYVGLVGASFRRHAPGTVPADVVVEDRRAAATRAAPRLAPRRRVVCLPLEPAPRRPRPRVARRAQLRPSGRRDGARPPDRLVPSLRRRAL